MELKMLNKNMDIFDIYIIILIFTFGLHLLQNKSQISKLQILFKNKYWLLSLVLLIFWCIYVFFTKNKLEIYSKEKQSRAILATKHAMIGFIITMCGYLDMTIFVFWLTWIISYYLEGWF